MRLIVCIFLIARLCASGEESLGKPKPGWLAVAAYFNKTVDKNADPCEDFYNYTCGKYNGSMGPLVDGLVPKLITDLKTSLDKLAKHISKSKYAPWTMQQLKKANDQCIGAKTTKSDMQKIMNFVKELGGFPILQPKNKPPMKEPSEIVAILASLGIDTLWSSALGPSIHDTRKTLISFDQASTFIPRLVYGRKELKTHAKNEKIKGLNKSINGLAVLLGLTLKQDQLKTDIQKLMDIDEKLAGFGDIAQDREFKQNEYNLITMDTKWKDIKWNTYIAIIEKLYQDQNILTKQTFDISNPEYFTKLNAYMHDFSKKAKEEQEALQNYMLITFFQQIDILIPGNEHLYLSNLYQKNKLGWQKSEEENPARDISCAIWLSNMLPHATSRAVVEYSWNKEPNNPKQKIQDIANNILAQFRIIMQSQKWMSDNSKNKIRDKVDNIQKNIAYPSWIMDNDFLDSKHPATKLNLTDAKNMVDVFMDLFKFNGWIKWHNLLVPQLRTDPGRGVASFPDSINAWYRADKNAINIPIAFAHRPTFDVDFPMAFNLGALGFVVGHEIGHGFDNHGTQCDQTGQFHDVIDQKSRPGYEKMEKCLINQYNQTCNKEYKICINGSRTLGENMADNAGMISSYNAYKNYIAQHGEEEHLPGNWNKLTMKQVFFLAFAHTWCQPVPKPEDKKRVIISGMVTDVHSPAKWRVINTLKNFPEFAKEFKCKPKSVMAQKKCDGWLTEEKPSTTTKGPTTTPHGGTSKLASCQAVLFVFASFVLVLNK